MKIAGRCPMCGNETLRTILLTMQPITEAVARVACSWPDCPRPMAADEILHLEMAHVVKFEPTGFEVQHTLAERLLGHMLDCPLHTYLVSLDKPPVPPGRYYAVEDGSTWFFQKMETP